MSAQREEKDLCLLGVFEFRMARIMNYGMCCVSRVHNLCASSECDMECGLTPRPPNAYHLLVATVFYGSTSRLERVEIHTRSVQLANNPLCKL